MPSAFPSPSPSPSPAPAPQPRSRGHSHHHHHIRPWLHAHRVRESLTSRIARLLCSLLLSLLAVAGVLAFIVWLALRPHRPRFHVSSFSAPGLAPGSSVSFDLTDRNPNGEIGIYYDAMAGSVYYRERPIGAAPLLFPFYQPPKNTTLIHGVLAGGSLKVGDEAQQQFADDAAGGRVAFRLELSSTIRFRVSSWDTHRHRLHVSCFVVVGPDGNILPESRDRRCSIYF